MSRGRRITAARHLRLLATLEHLAFEGNASELRRLLGSVDPLECRELAAEIERENPSPQLRLIERVEEYSVRV